MDDDSVPLSEQERRLAELVLAFMGDRIHEPFEPFVTYDRPMDRIWVLTRDCSICEVSVGGVLILLENNYPEEGQEKCVGFAIEPAQRFYRQRNLPTTVKYPLSTLLDEVLDE